MADDKVSDSRDESDESTPVDPTGAQLAEPDLPEASGELTETPAELTDRADLTDPEDTADDKYVDDPDTPDVNEAKLERATDEVSGDEPTEAASRRSSRAGRPVRKDRVTETDAATPAEQPTRSGSARTRTTAPVRKDDATRGEAETTTKRKSERTTPAKFVAESIAELRKVVWPTGTQVQQYFVVVLVFVLFIMTVVSLLDLAFGWVILRIFG